MRSIAPAVVASCLLIAGGVPAQTPKDAQSSYEPRSAPGSGQKYLDKFAGDWDVSKVFYPRSGEPVRISGQCRQSMIQGGRFLQSEFVFGQGDKKSTGLGIIGFEPESGRFTSFWVDSRQTRMSARQSRDRFDGDKIVLYSLVLEPDGKETRRSRTVSQLDQDGRRLLHRQYALGTGGEERLMMELIMTRKP
jgi:Protein of unknown function (DUF1579)